MMLSRWTQTLTISLSEDGDISQCHSSWLYSGEIAARYSICDAAAVTDSAHVSFLQTPNGFGFKTSLACHSSREDIATHLHTADPGRREGVTRNLSSLCHRKGSSPAAERVSTINCHREGRNPLHREPSPFTTSLRRLGTRRKHLAQGWSFNKSFAPYPAIRAQHGGCSPINHCVFQKKFLRQ